MDDAALFFSEAPWALPLYDALLCAMEARYPLLEVRVQKTQISFYHRRMFAALSLPRRKADREAHRLLLTPGLNRRLDAPQIAVATEPYPGR